MSGSMNYVGSISILDRGDAPAQAILDRNARSLAKRVADETKEELGKVMKRVETIYGTYEWSQEVSSKTADVEYIDDVRELEELIKDPVKLKKYQKQVTIFIVGYESVCGQKLRLLQQVNEFFMENASKIDDDDAQVKTPDIELDDMMETIDDTLKKTEDLALKLGDLNKEMVNYMYDYAQAKASTKSKKKLEKSLNQAKDDILSLNEKLLNLQQELEEREDRLQQMFKQTEVKNMEAQRYKTAAEVAKKSAEEADSLRDQLAERDEKIRLMRQEIDRMSIDLGETNINAMLKDNRLANAASESSTKISELQKSLENQMINMEGAKRELQRLHEKQIEDMSLSHREEVEELKNQHMEEVKRLLNEVEAAREATEKSGSRQSSKPDKELSDGEAADEAEEELKAKQTDKTKTSLEPLGEVQADFEDAFELEDEDSWASVPSGEVPGRFLQFRQLTKKKLDDLEKQLEGTVKKTGKKVNTLKAQFHEHKKRWEAERLVLLEQIEQSSKLHSEAEREADLAMSQLEDFINEQELLEQEEEQKRSSLDRMSREPTMSLAQAEKNLEETMEEQQSLEERLLSQTDDAKAEEQFKEMSRKATSVEEEASNQAESNASAKKSTLSRKMSQRSVTFAGGEGQSPEMVDMAVQTLAPEQEEVLASIRNMMNNEFNMEDPQQKILNVVRAAILTQDENVQTDDNIEEDLVRELKTRTMTIFTLASHISNESVLLGVEPSTVFKTFASLHSKVLSEDGEKKSMTFALPHTPKLTDEMLRRLTKSDMSNREEKLSGSSPEELRESATRSRASLRDQHKSALSQLKMSSEERRSKSPGLDSSLYMKSDLHGMELDENGDIPFPPDTGLSMHDIGTSPISFLRSAKSTKSEQPIPMAEHPIVLEYLKTYENVMKFKETLSTIFMDKEMMSVGQVLSDIEPIKFEVEDTVQPQVEEMTVNMLTVLDEVLQITSSVLANDRDYPVSSLLGALSRDPTRSLFTREHTTGAVPAVEPLYSQQGKRPSASESSHSDTKEKLEEFIEKYEHLQEKYKEEAEKHEKQLNHNTVVMMEMQDTIHNLQREVSNLGHKAQEYAPPQTARVQSPPIMFSRLDSERNAKVMKRAVNEKRLNQEKYKSAVDAMDKYVEIPAKRLANLANKYSHHRQMQNVEDAVRQSSQLDEDVFEVLDKMEKLQNERAQRWASQMDSLGSERLNLTNFLMVTLDDIERESGIFLIKPMFSYRAPFKPNVYQGKLSRAYKPPRTGAVQFSVHPLVNTPASQHRPSIQSARSTNQPHPPNRKQDDPSAGVSGKTRELVGDYARPTWNPYEAVQNTSQNDAMWAQVNTPRILELDINRMLIGQNQVSLSVPAALTSNDRLANAANLSTRTYATLSRPAGQEKKARNFSRPRSHTGASESAPPTTPMRDSTPGSAASSTKKVRIEENVQVLDEEDENSGGATSRTIPATSPLPPISARQGSAGLPVPPVSPPGSSLRQSPSFVRTFTEDMTLQPEDVQPEITELQDEMLPAQAVVT